MVAGVTPMPVIYGYPRWSSEDQGEGSSEERQRASIMSYAAELGGRVEWWTDAGVSAWNGNNLKNGCIARLAHDILSGKREPGILMVDEPSRFSRADFVDTLAFLTPLLQRGTQFAVAQRKLLLRKGDDAAFFSLFQFLVESQGGHTENVKRIGQVRKETTIRRARLKPGIVWSSRVTDWLTCSKATRKNDHEQKVTVIPGRGELVVEFFELSVAYGSQRLSKLLNERAKTDPKYKSWRGTEWTPDMLSNLLSNRAVLGEFQPHETRPRPGAVANPLTRYKKPPIVRTPTGEVIVGYYPVVIGPDLWDRVQAAKALRARVKSGRPSRENVNLFSGLCRCGVCDSPMHLRGKNRRGKNDWLICPGSARGVCANNTYYSVTRLERAFLRTGLTMLASASDFSIGREEADALAAKLDEARKAGAAALKGLDNARAMIPYTDNDADRAVIVASVKDARQQLEQAQAERDSIERALTEARGDDPEDAMRRAEFLTADAQQGDAEARTALAAIIKSVIARVEFVDGKVFISPARPASTWSGEAEATDPTRRSTRLARRLVVEFGHNSRGRHVVEHDETLSIERSHEARTEFDAVA